MKLVKACIALAAFAAIFVVPSMASAVTLTAPTGSAVAVGTEIIGTNVEHSATPTTTRMITSVGNVECTTAELRGKLTANGGANVEGNIETATFTGTSGVKPHTTHCTGTGLLGSSVTVTPDHTNPVIHNGVTSLPWCVKAGAENKITVRGGKCSEATRPVTFILHGNITCTYEKAVVEGTYTTHPAQAVATVQNQEFVRNTTSSAFCPVGKLNMAFTLETAAGAAYVDK